MIKDRKFPRLNLSCDVEYTVDNEFPASSYHRESSKTKDISTGGMCFITYNNLPLGTIIKLKFRLGNEEHPMEVKGRVVWSEMFNIGGMEGWDNGVEFIDIAEKDRYRILKYIDSRL